MWEIYQTIRKVYGIQTPNTTTLLIHINTTVAFLLLYDDRGNHFLVAVVAAIRRYINFNDFCWHILFQESTLQQLGDLCFHKHLLDIVVFCLQQLSPWSEVTICQYPSWFKESKCMIPDKQELMCVPCLLWQWICVIQDAIKWAIIQAWNHIFPQACGNSAFITCT